MAGEKLSYSIPAAAEKLDIGVSLLRQMIANSEVAVRYFGTKPVIEHTELQSLLESRPTERPSK